MPLLFLLLARPIELIIKLFLNETRRRLSIDFHLRKSKWQAIIVIPE